MRSTMPKYDEKTETFIIRIWVEPREFAEAPLVWTGELEHVTSHKRYYFRNLNKLLALLRPHLAALGIQPDPATKD